MDGVFDKDIVYSVSGLAFLYLDGVLGFFVGTLGVVEKYAVWKKYHQYHQYTISLLDLSMYVFTFHKNYSDGSSLHYKI